MGRVAWQAADESTFRAKTGGTEPSSGAGSPGSSIAEGSLPPTEASVSGTKRADEDTMQTTGPQHPEGEAGRKIEPHLPKDGTALSAEVDTVEAEHPKEDTAQRTEPQHSKEMTAPMIEDGIAGTKPEEEEGEMQKNATDTAEAKRPKEACQECGTAPPCRTCMSANAPASGLTPNPTPPTTAHRDAEVARPRPPSEAASSDSATSCAWTATSDDALAPADLARPAEVTAEAAAAAAEPEEEDDAAARNTEAHVLEHAERERSGGDHPRRAEVGAGEEGRSHVTTHYTRHEEAWRATATAAELQNLADDLYSAAMSKRSEEEAAREPERQLLHGGTSQGPAAGTHEAKRADKEAAPQQSTKASLDERARARYRCKRAEEAAYQELLKMDKAARAATAADQRARAAPHTRVPGGTEPLRQDPSHTTPDPAPPAHAHGDPGKRPKKPQLVDAIMALRRSSGGLERAWGDFCVQEARNLDSGLDGVLDPNRHGAPALAAFLDTHRDDDNGVPRGLSPRQTRPTPSQWQPTLPKNPAPLRSADIATHARAPDPKRFEEDHACWDDEDTRTKDADKDKAQGTKTVTSTVGPRQTDAPPNTAPAHPPEPVPAQPSSLGDSAAEGKARDQGEWVNACWHMRNLGYCPREGPPQCLRCSGTLAPGKVAGRSDKGQLVEQVKALQGTCGDARQAWQDLCDREPKGTRDPERHDKETLSQFITSRSGRGPKPRAWAPGAVPEHNDGPALETDEEAVQARWGADSGVRERWADAPEAATAVAQQTGADTKHEEGGWTAARPGRGWADWDQLAGLAEQVKALQRSSEEARQAWRDLCDQKHKGTCDPKWHDEGTLRLFIASCADGGPKSQSWTLLNAPPRGADAGREPTKEAERSRFDTKIVADDASEGQLYADAAHDDGGWTAAPPGGGRSDTDLLVEQVKALQRSGDDAKLAWGDLCDRKLKGTRDPRRHDPNTLRQFIASRGASGPPPRAWTPVAVPERDAGTDHAATEGAGRPRYGRSGLNWSGGEKQNPDNQR